MRKIRADPAKVPDFINLVTRYCRSNSSWG
jgi:hypothetical protein